jgi:hypothetical protein
MLEVASQSLAVCCAFKAIGLLQYWAAGSQFPRAGPARRATVTYRCTPKAQRARPRFRVTEDPSFRRTDAAVLLVLSVLDASPLATLTRSPHCHLRPTAPIMPARARRQRPKTSFSLLR